MAAKHNVRIHYSEDGTKEIPGREQDTANRRQNQYKRCQTTWHTTETNTRGIPHHPKPQDTKEAGHQREAADNREPGHQYLRTAKNREQTTTQHETRITEIENQHRNMTTINDQMSTTSQEQTGTGALTLGPGPHKQTL